MLIGMAQSPASYLIHILIPSATFSSMCIPLVHWSILGGNGISVIQQSRSAVSGNVGLIPKLTCQNVPSLAQKHTSREDVMNTQT